MEEETPVVETPNEEVAPTVTEVAPEITEDSTKEAEPLSSFQVDEHTHATAPLQVQFVK